MVHYLLMLSSIPSTKPKMNVRGKTELTVLRAVEEEDWEKET